MYFILFPMLVVYSRSANVVFHVAKDIGKRSNQSYSTA